MVAGIQEKALYVLRHSSLQGTNLLVWPAEYNDSSMLRNSLAFTLAKSICPEQWTADFKYVHLYANSDYLGLYLLCEHKEAKEGRVNVYRPEDGYTGVDIGYFFERDDYFNPNHEDIGFYIHANTT